VAREHALVQPLQPRVHRLVDRRSEHLDAAMLTTL
jgi:hypothetical protein